MGGGIGCVLICDEGRGGGRDRTHVDPSGSEVRVQSFGVDDYNTIALFFPVKSVLCVKFTAELFRFECVLIWGEGRGWRRARTLATWPCIYIYR